MTTSSETAQPTTEPPRGPIVARAGRYYRNTRFIMVLILFGYGLWSIRDGFFAWPKANAEALERARQEAVQKGLDPDKVVDPEKVVPHPGLDVPFNKVIGVAMPPLALALLAWVLYNSRGQYLLDGQTLHVPGHPPVPFENITEIDKRLWDRKGIAYIRYDLGDGRKGRLRLDDFVYDRDATDEIYRRIEQYINPAQAGSEPPENTKAQG